MSAKVKFNYLGIDLFTAEPLGVCRGKAAYLASWGGAKASCKQLPSAGRESRSQGALRA